jgi:hypothetical protein
MVARKEGAARGGASSGSHDAEGGLRRPLRHRAGDFPNRTGVALSKLLPVISTPEPSGRWPVRHAGFWERAVEPR